MKYQQENSLPILNNKNDSNISYNNIIYNNINYTMTGPKQLIKLSITTD